MHIFLRTYEKVIKLSANPRAKIYLFLLSFSESSFFPIPPDVMLAPMCLAQPSQKWNLAFLTTLGSVLGGCLGYFVGLYGFVFIEPLIESYGYADSFEQAIYWFQTWGFWAIFIAGFSPIPYKIFTIAGGVMTMSFPLFLIASFLGRGLRFFLLALFIKLFGKQFDFYLKRYINHLVYFFLFGILVLVIIY